VLFTKAIDIKDGVINFNIKIWFNKIFAKKL
jgi:hypothetical protein